MNWRWLWQYGGNQISWTTSGVEQKHRGYLHLGDWRKNLEVTETWDAVYFLVSYASKNCMHQYTYIYGIWSRQDDSSHRPDERESRKERKEIANVSLIEQCFADIGQSLDAYLSETTWTWFNQRFLFCWHRLGRSDVWLVSNWASDFPSSTSRHVVATRHRSHSPSWPIYSIFQCSNREIGDYVFISYQMSNWINNVSHDQHHNRKSMTAFVAAPPKTPRTPRTTIIRVIDQPPATIVTMKPKPSQKLLSLQGKQLKSQVQKLHG
jgi:hypothetical protein